MGLRLLIVLAALHCGPLALGYQAPTWQGLVWRFNLPVTRQSNAGAGHGKDHFIASAHTIDNASADGVTIFGNGYGSSVWDISLRIKVDGVFQTERRFAAPGDGHWHWSNLQKQPQQGIWRNAFNQSEFRYFGYNTNDTLLNMFLDGGWSNATGGEPLDYRTQKSAFLWVPGMLTPVTNVTYSLLQSHGWAGQISYGLDPADRSRWGVPKRAEFWVRAWMFYPQFLEAWWYDPFYWNRDDHAGYFGGNPYEGVSVYFNRRSGSAKELAVPSGQLEIIKETQHKGFQVGIRAFGMNRHDRWMIYRRDFADGNPHPADAPQIGYAKNTAQAFFAGKHFGNQIATGNADTNSGWKSATFTSTKGGLTRYYLVMRGNSDWGWHRVVDVVDVRPYEINVDYAFTSPDPTCSWVLKNGSTIPVWRTRVDKGFTFQLSVIDTATEAHDLGDQHVAVRAVRSPEHTFSWSTAWWLDKAKQSLVTGNYQSSWESAPNPPLATGFRKGSHTLKFVPGDLGGLIGKKGRLGFNAWRQHVRTTHLTNLNLSTGSRLPHTAFPENEALCLDIHPFATATASAVFADGTQWVDTLETDRSIDFGAQCPLHIALTFQNAYPLGGLYLFLTKPDNHSICLAHNFNHTATPIGSADLTDHVDDPGDYYLRVLEFNPFDNDSLADFASNPSLPPGSGQTNAGFFAPYGTAMGWRKLGEFRFSIPNEVRVRGMLIGGGVTQ